MQIFSYIFYILITELADFRTPSWLIFEHRVGGSLRLVTRREATSTAMSRTN